MKRLSFLSVLLMAASVFLFLGWCQKEEKSYLKQDSIDHFLDENFFPLGCKYYNPPNEQKVESRSKSEIELKLKDFFIQNKDHI